MSNKHYMELINGFQLPLSRKEAILQAIFLIRKKSYDSSLLIIDNYKIQKDELSCFNLQDEEISKFTQYLKLKKIN